MKGYRTHPTETYLLSDPSQTVAVNQEEDEFSIDISGLPENNLVNVIVVEYEGELEYVPSNTVALSDDGLYTLTSKNATDFHSLSGEDYYSTEPTVVEKEWYILNPGKEEFALRLHYSTNEIGRGLQATINGESIELTLDEQPETDSNGNFVKEAGNIDLVQNKLNKIELNWDDQSNPHKDLAIEHLEIVLY